MNEHPAPVALSRRAIAKIIDQTVMGITIYGLSTRLPVWVAAALGIGWFLASDWAGSPGKWLLRLRAVDAHTGGRPTLVQSVIRNLPFIVRNVGLAVGAIATQTSTVLFRQSHPFIAGGLALVALIISLMMWEEARRNQDGRRPMDAGVTVIPR